MTSSLEYAPHDNQEGRSFFRRLCEAVIELPTAVRIAIGMILTGESRGTISKRSKINLRSEKH